MINKIKIEIENLEAEKRRLNQSGLPIELRLPILQWLEAEIGHRSLAIAKLRRLMNPPCFPSWAIGKAQTAYIPVCARLVG